VELSPSVLRELNATTATRENPHAAVDRLLTLFGPEHIDNYYGITPIVSGIINEAAEQTIGPDSNFELVIDEAVFEASFTDHPDALQLAYDLPQFELFVSPTDINIGLQIFDGKAFLGAYDDFGNIVACVDGDNEQFVEWAKDIYTTYRDAATKPPDGAMSLEELHGHGQ
jgi:hypothetical protein